MHAVLFQLTHLHASLHSFVFDADMGGSLLKETCTGPLYPKSAALCVAVCCSVLQRGEICCEQRSDIKDALLPIKEDQTVSNVTCMSPHMRPICYQKSPTAKLPLFAMKL